MEKRALKVTLVIASLNLAIASAQAQTVSLLDENFDTGLPGSAQTIGGNSVNLRAGTDAINTYNAGNPYQRFSIASGTTFFNNSVSNQFLVLGDNSGQLAGSPSSGTFGYATSFSLANGTTDITVSFDWVFSEFGSGGDSDQFQVGVTGNGFDINAPLTTNHSLLRQLLTNNGKVYGPTTLNIAVSNLGAADANGNYWLSFGLFENASSNNSAVGIDNIKITANVAPVPLPAAVWSFLTGFMGWLALCKRKPLAA